MDKSPKLDYKAIASQIYDWLKTRRSKKEISTRDVVKVLGGQDGSIAWDENDCWQIHECLLNKIKKEREYVADFSAYKDMYVGLPYNIPFVFRKK